MKKYSRSPRVVALDVETTGLSPNHGHRIIEIGAVAIENGRMIEEFHALVNAGRRISLAAQEVHGITDEMLVGHPPPEVVYPELHRFITGSLLVAHNAPFDISFLRHEFYRLGLSLNQSVVCTLNHSRRYCRGLSNYRLETVARYFLGALPFDRRRHRALDDARLVAQVWMALEGR